MEPSLLLLNINRMTLQCWVGSFKFGDKSYCLVHLAEYVNPRVTNEYNCPLLTSSNINYCRESVCVKHLVSVAHECSNSLYWHYQTSLLQWISVCKAVSVAHECSKLMYFYKCLSFKCTRKGIVFRYVSLFQPGLVKQLYCLILYHSTS